MHARPHGALTSLVNEKGKEHSGGGTCNAIKKVVFSDYSLCGSGRGDGQMHGQARNIRGEREIE